MGVLRGWPRWLGSIRVRVLAVVVVLLVVSSIGSVLLLRAALYSRLDDEIEVELEQEAEEFQLLSQGNDPDTGEPFDGDLRAIFDTYFAREVPDEGESLLAFVDGELYEARRVQGAARARELGPAIAYWLSLDQAERGTVDTFRGEARYVALPLAGDAVDGLFVIANFPARERGEIDDAVRTLILILLATTLLIGTIGLVIAGRILRPLTTLATTARRVSDTDLERRIPVSGRDEASQIAGAFNEMLDRLERAFTNQRRFLRDTSHELRTPLTVVRGHAQLIELGHTAAERRETVALLVDEIDRMSRLVDDLSLLAMAELPEFVERRPIDLHDLVIACHRKTEVLADRDWRVDAPSSVMVHGDPRRLSQAMIQLATNAVAHTRAGDGIELGVCRRDGAAILWVDDAGAGVEPTLASQIFERSVRGERSTGGGLGLNIVQAITHAHGGSVKLVPSKLGGARFEIAIPLGAGAAGPPLEDVWPSSRPPYTSRSSGPNPVTTPDNHRSKRG